jgi:hypothetical protein
MELKNKIIDRFFNIYVPISHASRCVSIAFSAEISKRIVLKPVCCFQVPVFLNIHVFGGRAVHIMVFPFIWKYRISWRGFFFWGVLVVRIAVSRRELKYKPQKRVKYVSGNYGIEIYVCYIQSSRKEHEKIIWKVQQWVNRVCTTEWNAVSLLLTNLFLLTK